jgi:hypothetical protein
LMKKAAIMIDLVPEAEQEENEVIKTQIMKETFVGGIPFCAQIAFVEIREHSNGFEELLEKEGFSKDIAEKIFCMYTS